MKLNLISRKRSVKLGEEMKNGSQLIGYVQSVKHLKGNRWEIVIARGSR